MSMFIGDYSGKVDVKGRMIIPSQFRKNCKGGERFVLKQNVFSQALDLYPYEEWAEELVRFKERLNFYNPAHSKLLIEYCRGVAEILLDKSGRILLPKRMVEYAGIEKCVVVVGAVEKIMIWDEKTYEAEQLSQTDFENLLVKTLGDE